MPPRSGSPRLLVIAGPTAAGKSRAALHAARLLDGEIVNADSVQVYRHFDVGSAKPSAEEMRAVRHHCVDIAEPDEPFTMADFRDHARRAVADIASRGKTPIVCGGSGLYIKALLEGLSGGAAPDADLRRSLLSRDLPELHAQLRALDPARAAQLHPNDRHRIIRGIENALLPPKGEVPEKEFDYDFFVLSAPRGIMYRNVEERVDAMLARGMVDEVRGLLARGHDSRSKPFQSVGYRQVALFLEGALSESGLPEAMKRATRNYAKRQITWFSRVPGGIWLNAASMGVEAAAGHMADYFRRV